MPLVVSPLEKSKREAREAARRELLRPFDFSGVESFGIDRDDAIAQLMKRTREKAFDLLRKEFGARARFWPRPKDPFACDFYWRRGNVALNLTGPLVEEAAPRRRPTTDHLSGAGAFNSRGAASTAKILIVRYYEVWHNPERFLAYVRSALVASGKYPDLK